MLIIMGFRSVFERFLSYKMFLFAPNEANSFNIVGDFHKFLF